MDSLLITIYYVSLFYDFDVKSPTLRIALKRWIHLDKFLEQNKLKEKNQFSDEIQKIIKHRIHHDGESIKGGELEKSI